LDRHAGAFQNRENRAAMPKNFPYSGNLEQELDIQKNASPEQQREKQCAGKRLK
jgi:hypothetical protein